MVAQIDRKLFKLSKKKVYQRLVSFILFEGRPLTSRAKYINMLSLRFLRYISNTNSQELNKPIFVVGTGRSGTTIISNTLGLHERVAFLNEPKAIWSIVNASDDIVGNFNLAPAKYRLTNQELGNVDDRRLINMYSFFLFITRSNRILDKYPENIYRVNILKSIFPDCKILFVYRNGHNTAASIKNWSNRFKKKNSDDTYNWWGVNDCKWNLLCDELVRNDDSLSISYEKIKTYNDEYCRGVVEWIMSMKEGLELVNRDLVYPVKFEKYISNVEYRDRVLEYCELGESDLFNKYCKAVLKPNKNYPDAPIPSLIKKEFFELMKIYYDT